MTRISTLTPAQRTAFAHIAGGNPRGLRFNLKIIAALERAGLVKIVDITGPSMFTTFEPRATDEALAEWKLWLNRKQNQPF